MLKIQEVSGKDANTNRALLKCYDRSKKLSCAFAFKKSVAIAFVQFCGLRC